jgi:MoaA/NifB/PqqE/SkfB family radical SAM enzyme
MKIQISLSTKCNIHCRFCLKEKLREDFGFVENIDMDTDLALKIVEYKCDKIQICSNRGEALVHPDLDMILRRAVDNNKIDFVTNASLKNEKWWKDLGYLFGNRNSVIFPLDGVGNKSHKKHRQSDFYTVLRNIEAYVNAGGKAIWRYIVFEHNQHQIELAREISKNLGVDFNVMKSHTYDDVLRNPTEISQRKSNQLYFPCDNQEVYVNVKGYLFPCCFMANVFGNEPLRKRHHEKELVRLFEKEMVMLNLKNSSIEYITKNSKFFNKAMEKYSHICKNACYNWSVNQL